MAESVSVRLPDDLVGLLDEWASTTGQGRADVLREAVRAGLRVQRLEHAVDAFRTRRATLGRAAELAGVPVTAFLDELRRAGVLLHYDLDDLSEDLERADVP